MKKQISVKATASRLVLCSFVALSLTFAFAQPKPGTAPPVSVQPQPSQPPQELKVTEYSLPPEKLAKAEALYKTRTVLYLFGMLFGIVVLWVLLKLRVAPAFRDLTERVSKNGFVQTLVFVPLLTLLIAVITLPLDIYEQRISRAYGLSVQGWSSWAGDWCKAEAVSLVITVLAVAALFRIIRKSPQRWWFYFWLLTQPFMVLLIFVAPVILDPMFNKFEPLDKTRPQLVSEIEKVTQRGGLNIPSDRMFEMEASEKVTTYNAYVTGIGATKRVVVWDNTSRDMTVPETLFVFGHEMGHYVLNHIYKGLAFFSAMTFLGFWLGRKIVLAMLARWGDAWHVRGVNDLAALPVLMLALSLLTLAGEPIGNAFSRYQEHQADVYGLEVTHGLFPHNGEVAASAFQKLGEKSYDYPTPNPLLVFWSYSHPSIAERIRFSLQYDPWDAPAGPKYVK
ncbi:MAG: M48 family metallopeptidase [Candidatus Sulfotelmatobacter sp.]